MRARGLFLGGMRASTKTRNLPAKTSALIFRDQTARTDRWQSRRLYREGDEWRLNNVLLLPFAGASW